MSEWRDTEIGLIPQDWDAVKFENLLEIPLRNGLDKPSRIRGDGYKMVNMNEIFAHSIIRNISMEFVPLTEKEKQTSLLRRNDLLFARQSLVLEGAGKCSIFDDEDTNVCFESHLIRARLNQTLSNSRFYYYFFSSKYGKKFVKTIVEQAVVAGIRGSDLKNLVVPQPPKQQQDKIADVLSCLDTKIENLRSQNQTLEKIAQTLFNYWFIDFEFPNDSGEPYKSSGGAMIDSELGDIPVGWEVQSLRSVMTLNYGKSLTSETRVNGAYPVIGSNGIVGNHNKFIVDAPGIVIGRKGTIGKVIWVEDNFYPIDTTFYITDCLGCVGLYFHYFLIKNQEFNRLTSDSAVPGLNRETVYCVETVIPNISIIDRYNSIVKVIFQKINNNSQQIQTLTKTRDTLLPKLMSGQIRVAE